MSHVAVVETRQQPEPPPWCLSEIRTALFSGKASRKSCTARTVSGRNGTAAGFDGSSEVFETTSKSDDSHHHFSHISPVPLVFSFL
jgi:hypothetical protein